MRRSVGGRCCPAVCLSMFRFGSDAARGAAESVGGSEQSLAQGMRLRRLTPRFLFSEVLVWRARGVDCSSAAFWGPRCLFRSGCQRCLRYQIGNCGLGCGFGCGRSGCRNMVSVPLGDSRVMSDIPSQIHSPAAIMAGDPRYGAKARWRRGSCGGGNLDVAIGPRHGDIANKFL